MLCVEAASADAQVFARQASCPTCVNGQCGLPRPSAPMFAGVPAPAPQAMPTACYAQGECPCSPCDCTAGSCPGSCPTTGPVRRFVRRLTGRR